MNVSVHEEARRWATYWCQRWFLSKDGHDRLRTPSGISAGWASHTETFLLLLDFALEELGEAPARAPLVTRLKANGIDRMLRSWGLRIAGRRLDRATVHPHVVFVIEIPTPSMFEPARLVAAAMPAEQRTVLCADPRVSRSLREHDMEGVALTLPLREQVRVLRSEARQFAKRLAEVGADPPEMLLGGRDVAPLVLQRLGRTLRRTLPWLGVERLALRRAMEQFEPGAIAIASDQHRVGRLTTEVAAEMGIPVTVLQHGLPQAEIGYLPVVADRVAAWSEDSAAWFTEHGTNERRVQVLGNPRSDPLVSRRPAHPPPPDVRAPRLLCALSPSALSANQTVISRALEALDRLPRAELVVKLHPGYRDWSWVDGLVRASAAVERVRVSQHEDLTALLRRADVTLVHRSTVALESLVAGTPVVAMAAEEPSIAEMELKHLDLPVAKDAAGLVDAVTWLNDPAERSAWFDQRDAAISRAAGPLDGHSARRIADVLRRDASERLDR